MVGLDLLQSHLQITFSHFPGQRLLVQSAEVCFCFGLLSC